MNRKRIQRLRREKATIGAASLGKPNVESGGVKLPTPEIASAKMALWKEPAGRLEESHFCASSVVTSYEATRRGDGLSASSLEIRSCGMSNAFMCFTQALAILR